MNARLTQLSGLLVACLLILPSSASAQQWSPAQQEVWRTVEAYSQMFQQRNLDGALAYFHDDYRGWYNRNALPNTKQSLQLWLPHHFANSRVIVSEVQPLAIQVFDDVAVVHYNYSEIVQQGDNAPRHETGRWTDVLKKVNGRWLIIGDHGGQTSN
jgi:ketosteroid isomerase-like protein